MVKRNDEPELHSEPETELVSRARAGDRGAFGELVRLHRGAVCVLVRRYIRDDDDAQEVVQRSLVRAYDALPEFRGDASFRTWLCRIATNLSLNHLRDRRRFRPAEVEDVDAITNSLATGRVVAREAKTRVASALQQLPDKQRVAVELRLIQELPFNEIAEALECSEDSAKSNYHHGIKRLREVLREYAT
jgi:RNA polymerase sigma-70 factor (ECF subfamily)